MSLINHIKAHNKAYSLGFLAVVAAVVGFLFIQVDNLAVNQELTGALIRPIQLKTQIAPAMPFNPSQVKFDPIPVCPDKRTVMIQVPGSRPIAQTISCSDGQVFIGPDANGNFKCLQPNTTCAANQSVNCKDNTCK